MLEVQQHDLRYIYSFRYYSVVASGPSFTDSTIFLAMPPQLGLETPFYFDGSWNVCNLRLFVAFEKPMWSSVYKIIIKCICDRFLSFSILPLLENSGDNHMTTCILNINVDHSVSCARSLYFVILDALISLVAWYSFICQIHGISWKDTIYQ